MGPVTDTSSSRSLADLDGGERASGSADSASPRDTGCALPAPHHLACGVAAGGGGDDPRQRGPNRLRRTGRSIIVRAVLIRDRETFASTLAVLGLTYQVDLE